MSFPLIGIVKHIIQHLNRLRMLQSSMLLVAHRLCQILVNQLSHLLPYWRCVHPQQMVAFGNKLLANQINRSIGAYGTSFVKDLLDEASVGQNDCSSWTNLETENASILLRPLCKSGMALVRLCDAIDGCTGNSLQEELFSRKLMYVANYW
jgi:hypothetical protein